MRWLILSWQLGFAALASSALAQNQVYITGESEQHAGIIPIGDSTTFEFHAVAGGGSPRFYYYTIIRQLSGDSVFHSINAPQIGYSPSYPAERVKIRFRPVEPGSFEATFEVASTGFAPATILVKARAVEGPLDKRVILPISRREIWNIPVGDSATVSFPALVVGGDSNSLHSTQITLIEGDTTIFAINSPLIASALDRSDSILIRFRPNKPDYVEATFEVSSPGFTPALFWIRGTGRTLGVERHFQKSPEVRIDNHLIRVVSAAGDATMISVFNLLGCLVGRVSGHELQIDHLPAGIYYAIVAVNGARLMVKMVHSR